MFLSLSLSSVVLSPLLPSFIFKVKCIHSTFILPNRCIDLVHPRVTQNRFGFHDSLFPPPLGFSIYFQVANRERGGGMSQVLNMV